MCGICGDIRLNHQITSRAVIEKMNQHQVCRGPDDAGIYIDGPVGLGHRRLAIIDLSKKSSQPLYDAQHDLVLVFNGAIYNYRKLRTELKKQGHQFNSEGDSEVILKAWAQWGECCVNHLIGMFAFVIYDRKQQLCFMARDRLGIKPLYYAPTANRIRFASSLPALLAGGDINTQLDQQALHHQFTLHGVVPAPMTVFNGIRKLPPGYVMRIPLQGLPLTIPYWNLIAHRPPKPKTPEEWTQAITQSLMTAVKRHQLADVDVGVLLSGGLDSSLLVALLAEQGQEKIQTFSIGFEDHLAESGNEFTYSDQVAQHYQTEHHQIQIANHQIIEQLPKAIGKMHEPMFAQDAIGFYLLAQQVSKTVKVVQSGQGADEIFAGYFWYQQMAQWGGDPLRRFARFYFDRDHNEYLQMITPEYCADDFTADTISHYLSSPFAQTYMDAVLRMDTTMLITDDPIKRVDNMTMAWGLEARVPFLDHELVELAASMPLDMKLGPTHSPSVGNHLGKHVLKTIARGHLSDELIDRPKAYFPVPPLKYVQGEFLSFMRDILNSTACQQRGLFQKNYVNTLLNNPENHFTRIRGNKLWHLAAFELWLQTMEDSV